MVENAVAMIEHAERDFASGNVRGALSWLESAYIPAQTNRDLSTVERALAVSREVMTGLSPGSRAHRKARRVADWYSELQRSYSMNAPPTATEATTAYEASAIAVGAAVSPAPAVQGNVPSLAWIDGLIAVLGLFTALELIGGVLIGLAGNTTEWKVLGIVGGVFWATMLAAVIAVLRLLQQVERNTRA
jgi:hypothetical protein